MQDAVKRLNILVSSIRVSRVLQVWHLLTCSLPSARQCLYPFAQPHKLNGICLVLPSRPRFSSRNITEQHALN